MPDTTAQLQARYSSNLVGNVQTYQTDYLEDPQTIAIGGTGSANTRLFAGAKEAERGRHQFPDRRASAATTSELELNHFDLLIDWGWFYFITKPMFLALDFFYQLVGNFGIAILLVTVIVKLMFFPLANKSYASMAKMKSVQPQLAALKERYPDDKVKQQQEMMEIYKKEKINPIAGCLPVALQIPVFFSLYKVLFVTIEMRHAPFYGWIKDLSAPDPTNLFTLFGLLHFDPTQLPRVRSLPRARRLADHHGHHDVVPVEAQPDAAGSDPADDLRLDAADLHLHARGLPGGLGDLLGVEQHTLGFAAELDHAPQWREGGIVRQSQGDIRSKKAESKT